MDVSADRWAMRSEDRNGWSDGDESDTSRFSISWRVLNDGRHVGNGCLVAELGDDRDAVGDGSAVVDCDRRRIRVGDYNGLSYSGESGTIRFYVFRRVKNGGRHLTNGCLAAQLGDDQCGLGHRLHCGRVRSTVLQRRQGQRFGLRRRDWCRWIQRRLESSEG